MIKRSLLALSLMSLVACDRLETAEFKKERLAHEYREAMNDYQTGNLDGAVSRFQKICEEDPQNSSARFQLACLLQDHVKDYLAAYCAFHEYVMQRPESDKATLAKDRLVICEHELAKSLAETHGLKMSEEQRRTIERLKESVKSHEDREATLAKNVETLSIRNKQLVEETVRLKELMRDQAEAAKDHLATASDLAEARELLDDAESALAGDVGEAKELLAEDDKLAEEAVPEDEVALAKSMLDEDPGNDQPLIVQASDAKEKRDSLKKALAADKAAKAAKAKETEIPDTYVVQEGDTLYKIAVRFYGSSSAWKKIREANKTIVSTDGRVRKGQKLTLPK